jgi:hypothetical protein
VWYNDYNVQNNDNNNCNYVTNDDFSHSSYYCHYLGTATHCNGIHHDNEDSHPLVGQMGGTAVW